MKQVPWAAFISSLTGDVKKKGKIYRRGKENKKGKFKRRGKDNKEGKT
jgi:hypothetical protein